MDFNDYAFEKLVEIRLRELDAALGRHETAPAVDIRTNRSARRGLGLALIRAGTRLLRYARALASVVHRGPSLSRSRRAR